MVKFRGGHILDFKKQKKLLNACALGLLLIAPSAFANDVCKDDEQLERLLNQYKITANFNSDYISCKAMPDDSAQTLIAYADRVADISDEGIGEFNLSFLTVDSTTHKLIMLNRIKEPLFSDAISLNSIELDTAPFIAVPDIRLVGLRLNYSGHSQPNPFSMTVLNLYDLKNKKTVLDSFIVTRYRAETDTRCNADIEERKSILMMQKNKSQQYYDIQVHSNIDQYNFSGTSENCRESKHKISQQKFMLKFDGKQYQIPAQFKDEYLY